MLDRKGQFIELGDRVFFSTTHGSEILESRGKIMIMVYPKTCHIWLEGEDGSFLWSRFRTSVERIP